MVMVPAGGLAAEPSLLGPKGGGFFCAVHCSKSSTKQKGKAQHLV